MENITFDSLTTTVLVILALCGGINVVGATVKLIKDAIKPQASVRTMLENDKRRLDNHAKAIDALQEGQKMTCKGVQALLNHELHNGNANEMQEASSELNKWLINR